MPRYAKANQTIDDLKNKIESLGGIYDVLYSNPPSKLYSDIHDKLEVDGENSELIGEFDMPGTEDLKQFEMLNGVPIAWCGMGGDWEMPIVVALYIDDKGELRAYVPKDGNAYNKKNKAAFGNEDDDEFDEDKDYFFDSGKLRESVKNRIQAKVN